jgi:cellulose synthase/poly-beta-1,6-N-acetylglucosamine synthase-like glycosyltransferase
MSHKTRREELQSFVSVVVPVYNGRDTIRKCIEALLVQDYPQMLFEVFVVDNNSADGTDKIVRQYPVTLLYERQRQTSYAARNRGIRAARGDIVAFTDADCVPDPTWVSQLVAAFSRPSIAGVGGRILDAEAVNNVERFIAEVQPLRNAQRLEGSYHVSVVTANAAFRRSVLEALEGFDRRMRTGGDLDLSWRIQRENLGEIVYAPNAIVLHRHRSTLRDMYRQFHRYGYCSAMMTALHSGDAAYPQTPVWQRRQVLSQLGALLTYCASIVYRNTAGLIQGRSVYERSKPAYWLVAEGGALAGRLAAMWETHFFRRLPRAFVERET